MQVAPVCLHHPTTMKPSRPTKQKGNAHFWMEKRMVFLLNAATTFAAGLSFLSPPKSVKAEIQLSDLRAHKNGDTQVAPETHDTCMIAHAKVHHTRSEKAQTSAGTEGAKKKSTRRHQKPEWLAFGPVPFAFPLATLHEAEHEINC